MLGGMENRLVYNRRRATRRVDIRTRYCQGADCIPQVLARDLGHHGYQFVRLASLKRWERKFTPGIRWLLRSCGDYRGHYTAAPPYRATNRKLTGVLAMEIIVAVLLIAVSLVLLALVVDATRHPK